MPAATLIQPTQSASSEALREILPAPAQRIRVLIVKPSSLGDVVHTLPVVALLKETFPAWEFSWLISPEWQPLLQDNPDLAETITFPRQDLRIRWGAWRTIRGLRRELAEKGFELCLDFQGLLRSGIASWASGARIKIGLASAREGAGHFYDFRMEDRPAAPDQPVHAVQRYLGIAQALGIALPKGEDRLVWRIPAGETVEMAAPAQSSAPVILHPFSRGKGKSLTLKQVKHFCELIRRHAAVWIAGRCEEAVANEVKEMAGRLPGVRSFLNGTTVSQLIGLLRQASFTVSVDSGPMHLATALSPRVLSIHTWSNPAQVGPFHPDARVWKDGEIRPMAHYLTAEHRSIASLRRDSGAALPDSAVERIVQHVLDFMKDHPV